MSHERRDLAPRKIAGAIVAFVLLTVAVAGVAWLVVGGPLGGGGWPVPDDARPSAPGAELERLRARERELLHGYAWIDREAGVVRIPIGRAMDLVAERGLPVRKEKPR